MRIGRNDTIKIFSKEFKLNSFERIDYEKWINFIESHKDYFIWYENTEEGKQLTKNINKVPDWAKEGILYSLNKKKAYSTTKIVNQPYDFIVRYFSDEGVIKIDIEKKMTKEIAEILLKMAKLLEGKLIINGSKELKSIKDLS